MTPFQPEKLPEKAFFRLKWRHSRFYHSIQTLMQVSILLNVTNFSLVKTVCPVTNILFGTDQPGLKIAIGQGVSPVTRWLRVRLSVVFRWF